MKLGSTFFLKLVIFAIAFAVLAFCLLVLPRGIISDQTGYYRPILIGMYIPALPFFFALFQGFKLLTYIDSNAAFSKLSVKALQNIKYCAITIATLYTLGMPYIYYAAELDDAPGVILIGLVIIGAASMVGTFAAVLQKLVQNGLELKSENDLTV